TQEEGIDYDEVFALVARIEAIRLFLAYVSFMGFTVYQMDVKSAFLYGTIDEEVYVMQPPGFQDPELSMPCEALSREYSTSILRLEFKALMHEKFQMSAMGELNFFFGLQVLQKEDGIFLSQDKYGKDGTGKDVDLHLYRSMIGSLMNLTASRPDIMFAVYSDYGGATQDRKSTTGGCQFLGRRLILWQCKKQTIVATSTTEAEYVAAASCCGQVLWIQNQLLDYGLSMPCENLSKEISTSILRLLQLCDYHNMVVILEKSKHNVDFHPIVDFVEASPLRRNLKLQDEEGISSLPDTELFENLTLMGYNISTNQKFTFQKGFNEFSSNIATALVCLATNRTYNFSKMIFYGLVKNVNNKVLKLYPRVNNPSFSGRIVPLFDTMLIQQDEGSGTPTEPHHTPSQEAQPSSHTHISSPSIPTVTSVPTIPIPNVIPSETTPIRQYTRRARIAQSSALPPVADEPASLMRDVNQGEAYPTDSGFIADQDRATIAKSSTLPHDSAPRVTYPAAEEGRGMIGDRSRDGAPIKGRRIDEEEVVTERVSSDTEEVRLDEREVAAKRASKDTKEMATVLTTMGATTVLASGTAEVPTGSRSIPTPGPPASEVPTGSDVVPTASPVFATAIVVTPYRRKKGKEVMIARDAEIAIIHAKEELQSMIDGLDSNNETVAKYLEEYCQFSSELPMERRIELISDLVKYQDNYTKAKDFKGMTFEEVEAKFNSVCKQMEDFIPIEEVPEEVKSSDEVPEEKIKEMMQLVPIEGVYVKALQVKHPIIDWEVHTEGQRAYWKITRLGGNSASYQFFTDLLKHLDRDDLNQLWSLVKETPSKRPATTEWKLYDKCGVHQLTSKDKDIFTLVEKDYLLKKGLALVMISYKLQVENYS
nr:copia protein [Tanacetum cinerariifolium]